MGRTLTPAPPQKPQLEKILKERNPRGLRPSIHRRQKKVSTRIHRHRSVIKFGQITHLPEVGTSKFARFAEIGIGSQVLCYPPDNKARANSSIIMSDDKRGKVARKMLSYSSPVNSPIYSGPLHPISGRVSSTRIIQKQS